MIKSSAVHQASKFLINERPFSRQVVPQFIDCTGGNTHSRLFPTTYCDLPGWCHRAAELQEIWVLGPPRHTQGLPVCSEGPQMLWRDTLPRCESTCRTVWEVTIKRIFIEIWVTAQIPNTYNLNVNKNLQRTNILTWPSSCGWWWFMISGFSYDGVLVSLFFRNSDRWSSCELLTPTGVCGCATARPGTTERCRRCRPAQVCRSPGRAGRTAWGTPARQSSLG